MRIGSNLNKIKETKKSVGIEKCLKKLVKKKKTLRTYQGKL